jgi:hypothetical protein
MIRKPRLNRRIDAQGGLSMIDFARIERQFEETLGSSSETFHVFGLLSPVLTTQRPPSSRVHAK